MSGAGPVLDALLAAAIPAIAAAAVLRRDLVQSVMLLFSFGVVLAVVWARLGAADIAMVEAALGAGVTGVLFLATIARTRPTDARSPRGRAAWVGLAALCGAAVAPAGLAVASLPGDARGLVDVVLARVPETGASHPVTSVLLDFRAFDTLLEIAVLLLAVLGAWAARGRAIGPWGRAPRPGAILTEAVRILLPVVVILAGVLLWLGSSAPGGAFQAGTVLGTLAVLASVSRAVSVPRVPQWAVRAALALGFAVFLSVAGGAMLAGGALLDQPRAHAAGLLLAVEAALTLSIALVMAVLFEGEAAA